MVDGLLAADNASVGGAVRESIVYEKVDTDELRLAFDLVKSKMPKCGVPLLERHNPDGTRDQLQAKDILAGNLYLGAQAPLDCQFKHLLLDAPHLFADKFRIKKDQHLKTTRILWFWHLDPNHSLTFAHWQTRFRVNYLIMKLQDVGVAGLTKLEAAYFSAFLESRLNPASFEHREHYLEAWKRGEEPHVLPINYSQRIRLQKEMKRLRKGLEETYKNETTGMTSDLSLAARIFFEAWDFETKNPGSVESVSLPVLDAGELLEPLRCIVERYQEFVGVGKPTGKRPALDYDEFGRFVKQIRGLKTQSMLDAVDTFKDTMARFEGMQDKNTITE